MSEIAVRLAGLSPEKRELLEALLWKKRAEAASSAAIQPRSDVPGPFPLSFSQERLWLVHQLEPESSAYNIPIALRFTGDLMAGALRESFAAVVRRHEALRARFVLRDGEPVQEVDPPGVPPLPLIDLEGMPETVREVEARRLAEAEAGRPFDLQSGPLLRCLLLRLSRRDHVLLATMHHIVSDGWSAGIFAREMGAFYAAALSGRPAALPPLPIQYIDFALWQRRTLSGPALEKQLAFWRERLAGLDSVLELPSDRLRPARRTPRGSVVPFALPAPLSRELKALTGREGTTLFTTLFAAFFALLHRQTYKEDLCVGTPVAGRRQAEVEGLIGFFVTTLVVRAGLAGEPSFREHLARVHEAVLDAQSHQDLPFERLVSELAPERSLSYTPVFQVAFAFQNAPGQTLELPGMTVRGLELPPRTAKFDLTLVLWEEGGWIAGGLEHSLDLFDRPTIARTLGQLEALLTAVAADPSLPLPSIPLLSRPELHQLLVEWGGPREEASTQETLHGRFEERARQAPAAPAVTCGFTMLSYGELNLRANQLARHLRGLGVGPESRVGLCLERSLELVVGILGILKAGGAYVPLDPGYPRERLAYMIADAGVRIVVGTAESVAGLAGPAEAVLLDTGCEVLAALPGGDLQPLADGASLAYVIYTSGSTGRPKGALVSHGNGVRLFDATRSWFASGDQDVWTLFHSFAFDFSVWELWGALLHGGRVVVVPYEVSRSPELFLDLLVRERVTVLNQTPSAFAELARVDEERGGLATGLRLVVFGGEALDPAGLAPWFARHGDRKPLLVNMYGITETTVHVTYRPLRAEDTRRERRSVIGVPIPDLSLSVLDPWLRPAPIGVPGELAVGGAGLARGYLGRPELTASRFVPDPVGRRPGARLYRSGDLGRFLPDGEVEYLGRIDHQVKVRGFRIELGEIEAALEAHAGVRQAVVLPKEEPSGERRLVAFVVTQPGQEPQVGELRSALAGRLPDYMMPAAFVILESLPLNQNGKIDRKEPLSLAVPGRDEELDYAPPRTGAERALVEVWQEVLGLERVGIDDRFFTLGGDSILSIRARALAEKRGLSFALHQLFEHQTVRELAQHLGGEEDAPAPAEPFALLSERDRAALPAGLEDAYPLAALQTGMLFHGGYSADSSLYHNVASLRLETPFDDEALRAAVEQVLAHHAVLRTSFDLSRFSEPLQLVHRQVDAPLEVADLRGLPLEERERVVAEALEEERHRKLDVSIAPLLRLRVHRLEEGVFQLTWTEHHAILDGWSVATLRAELLRLYRKLRQGDTSPLPLPPPAAYRDFVALERRSLLSEEDRGFWLRKLEGAPRLRLPRWSGEGDGAPPSMRSRVWRVEPRLTERLRQLAGAMGAPLKNALLAAHYRALSAATGQTDLVSGLVANGRPESEGGERALGLFLNTLPLRLRLAGGTWLDLVRQTFEAERELSPFRRYPMADLQRRLGGGELFETAFNYTHFHVLEGMGDGETRVLAQMEQAETNFPCNASFSVSGPWLDLALEWDATRFQEAQIEALAGWYLRALEAMAARPEACYDAAPLLSDAELHQLLREWNDTGAPAPDRLVHELFDLRASSAPEAVAVVCGGRSLTYGELRDRSRRLARHLRSLGVGPEVRVGLLLDRSPELIVGILGILRAGGAYVPLDPGYPETRLRYIVEDSRMPVLVTRSDLARSLPAPGVSTVLLDRASEETGPGDFAGCSAANLAYVIYTSGSTGAPKGVQVGHGPLANAIGFSARRYRLRPADRVLQFASINFDASLEEIFTALTRGATLVLRDEAMLESPRRFLDTIAGLGITVLSLPTAYWHEIVAAGEAFWPSSVRLVSTGGERARAEHLARWLAQGLEAVELVNVYGPTEATIGCTCCTLRGPEPGEVPIGRPYDNARAYLLGSGLQSVPAGGAAGELYFGGDVLARGYLGRPDLTAERFLPDPFRGDPGARMYRTGDLAVYRPDGTLEFRGRADDQVKVRGFRIELREIETALCRHPGVLEAVVLLREDQGEASLIGYVVAGEEPRPSAAELHRFLRGQLPAYMVPAAFVLLDRLPITPNGKVDRAALPAPERTRELERDSLAPRDALELRLVRLWEELLGIQPIGVQDDFFELGGHSLLAVQLVARVQRGFGVSLPMAALLRNPTVERLATVLREGGEPSRAALVELAPGQGRPFFCIHAIGGEVLGYIHLARHLETDRPVYGIQVPGLDAGTPWTTLEEMAAWYLRALQEVQPTGPYTLGGWSMGGVVAVEMARQLEQEGEAVDLVVLIDSFAPGSGDRPAAGGELVALFAYDLARLFGIGLLELPPHFGQLAAGDALRWLSSEAKRLDILPPGLEDGELERRFAVFQANFRALERYSGGPCAAPLILFKAARSPADLGWGSRLIETHELPGDHYALLQQPHVQSLSALLRERLKAI